MPESCLFYYITDRKSFPGDERRRRTLLLDKIAEAASANIHYIQLREKDLSIRDLEFLAREAMRLIRQRRTENPHLRTDLLINSRADVSIATNAGGVHLPAHDLIPSEVREIWKTLRSAGAHASEIPPRVPLISVSCHSTEEVTQAASNGADLAIFAPIFEKKDLPSALPQGLAALRQACRANIPVIALGGITLQNADSCLQAGAAGIAAIRLFQENNIATIVRSLSAC